MLIPQTCDQLKTEDKPRISVGALMDLRRLIDAQFLQKAPKDRSRAESPTGGRMHSNEKPTGWQRRLHFQDEEIWNELPESVREQCRTLWRQVLASILKAGEWRQNEALA